MRVIYFELNSRIPIKIDRSVAAIGFFDGIHRGHQKLVEETVKQADKQGLTPALITFSPSPASILTNKPEKLLTTVSERAMLGKKLGIEVMIVLRFSKELSQLEPELFYTQIIKQLNIEHLVCGEDFRYGYRGSGSVATLKNIKELGLSVIKDFKYNDERVSSTIIKENLASGSVDKVEKLLGYAYELNGYVMHGRKKGRTIGFPTLNLSVEASKILPRDGVYIGISVIDKTNYISTVNIGHNPTINTVEKKSIESYVHNYNQDTYGQKVTFKIIERIRDEEKFDSVEKLIKQMDNDIEITQNYFNNEQRRFYNIESIQNS